ncbi:tRNA pseudouridine(38-40) synthase TruA [Paenibacillus sp. SC116]|uniref:tRNA pseudouridine(38-40) synthase TruA n=1 Tax=Paenibacillus sp. SC116 TaxID=2968986 RepID=UPI00215AE83D|nr:tRNA pseudouridine(38-40) synthase TruA [Paenibacillus sp. SC116]MCR8846739.1 tRNA pseudouridine(38-40) synthase TruA [Paenibacillus sp. SC116]
MRNIGMTVSYDGTAYSGFQRQPDQDTVQGRIEAAITKLTSDQITISASGRTDAGVHARGQVFNFHTTSAIPIDRWVLAMNSRLPNDIVVQEAWEAPLDFHARYSAKVKTYRYTILAERNPDLFRRLYEFHHPRPLDIEAMRKGMAYLEGEHDYTSFTSPKSTKQSNVRTIFRSWMEVEHAGSDEAGRGRIHLFLTGNGFLYNMVRIIAGTMMWVGEGKLRPEDIPVIMETLHRDAAGPMAVGHGLLLWSVEYDGEERI